MGRHCETAYRPPEDLPDPEIEPVSLEYHAFRADSLPLRHLGSSYTLYQIFHWFCVVINKEFYMKQLSTVVKMIILYSAWYPLGLMRKISFWS